MMFRCFIITQGSSSTHLRSAANGGGNGISILGQEGIGIKGTDVEASDSLLDLEEKWDTLSGIRSVGRRLDGTVAPCIVTS